MISDFEKHKENGDIQDPKLVTSARMIKSEFGLIKFNELAAIDVQSRFNALYGSNTRPRAMMKSGLEAFNNSRVYFDKLKRVKFEHDFEVEILIRELD